MIVSIAVSKNVTGVPAKRLSARCATQFGAFAALTISCGSPPLKSLA